MVANIIGLIILLFSLIGGASFVNTLITVAAFLFTLHIIIGILIVFMYSFIWFAWHSPEELEAKEAYGHLLVRIMRFLMGGSTSTSAFFLFILRRFSYIAGAYLIKASLVLPASLDPLLVLIGLVCIIIVPWIVKRVAKNR